MDAQEQRNDSRTRGRALLCEVTVRGIGVGVSWCWPVRIIFANTASEQRQLRLIISLRLRRVASGLI
jgi:hypothetical protein